MSKKRDATMNETLEPNTTGGAVVVDSDHPEQPNLEVQADDVYDESQPGFEFDESIIPRGVCLLYTSDAADE